MRFAKPPTSIAGQISLLLSRGMEIGDESVAAHHLSHISYYRLSAYWLPFEADHGTHQFQPGTRFTDTLNLYVFDRELRLLLLDAIERVEVSTRTRWMDVLVSAHGAHAHLDASHFVTKSDRKGQIIWAHDKALDSLKLEYSKSRETSIMHLRSFYDEPLPPLWATSELMTLGEFSKWFANTRSSSLRNLVSRAYQLDERILVSFLHHLAIIRNHCAHHARLCNREFTFRWTLPNRAPTGLVSALHPASGARIYNTLVMLAFLMELINPEAGWKHRLLALFDKHDADTGPMGFPTDYRLRSLWRTETSLPATEGQP
jgi:abortive infection bacteriophage resistance protein